MKRRAIYQVSTKFFMDVLNGRASFDLPDTTEIININVDHLRAMVEILARDDAFEVVGEGQMPPVLYDLKIKVPA